MRVEDCVTYEAAPYRAKDFDRQRSYRISLSLDGAARMGGTRALIEVGVYLHWKGRRPVDVAVDLSCMSGCTEHCSFCAAADLSPIELAAADIVAQASKALDEVATHERAFFKPSTERPAVTFSFQGMGEPSRMPDVVIEAVALLRARFDDKYRVQFTISTTAVDPEALRRWAAAGLGLHSLQVSLHGCSRAQRRELLHQDIEINRIFGALEEFHDASPETQIKLNYLLLSGRNDSNSDIQALRELIGDKPYYLKVSRLNKTEPAMRAGLRRPKAAAFRSFIGGVSEGRAPELTYLYGSDAEIQVSCGQLASYARRTPDSGRRRAIRDIYDRIVDGQAILFLGAGASTTLSSAEALAARLYGELGFETRFSDTGFTLRDVVDLYQAQNRRHEVDEVIRSAMEAAAYPPELLLLTFFPWKAIYTTNYDQFVERAYADAVKRRLSEHTCVAVRRTDELSRSLGDDTIRLVKLHGCISRPGEIVMSGSDYLTGYLDNRGFLFKMLEADALRYDVVFAGYSFRDEYVGSLIASLRRAVGRHGTATHAILPASEFQSEQAATLKDKFCAQLIPMSFAEFLSELVVLARRQIVYVAGSKKQTVGTGATRADFGEKIDALAALLGRVFTEEGIRIVTGATATDKFGYLVAAGMDEDLVTTYRWQGSSQIKDPDIGDEPSRMISVRDVGFKPSDVIEKMASVAHAAVFVGGGPLTLQEFSRLHGRGRFIIPVALGDDAYASDMIHAFFRKNARTIDTFSADRGLAIKEPHRQQERSLTLEQLDALDLSRNSPQLVADAISEILRDLRLAMPEADLAAVDPG